MKEEKIRILHIITLDVGGAAVAALRIGQAISEKHSNVINQYLVLHKSREGYPAKAYFSYSWQEQAARILRKMHEVVIEPKLEKYPGPFSKGEFGLFKQLNKHVKEIDIIHIHWIGRGFMSIKQLEKLSKIGKPIVWTMHDMWAFTGGCYYDGECNQYLKACESCICTKEKKNLVKIQKKKEKIFSKDVFHFVGCSRWITKCARNSSILSAQKNICCIPNGIDIKDFCPMDNEERINLRKQWNISRNKKIVLLGAMSSADKRKGGHLIADIVKNLNTQIYEVVIFGDVRNNIDTGNHQAKYVGMINDSATLRKLYACADVYIAPSIQENLANTVMESLSCGTPVVAFDIGGMADMIIPGVNGALVSPFEVTEFSEKIMECVGDAELRENARKYVIDNFEYHIIGEKYYKLYMQAIDGGK